MRRNTLGGQAWAEFVGTAVLLLLGDGVVANVVYATRGAGYDWNTITLGWGFAVVIAVYIAGGVTGAHINPAVTIAAMARGTMNAMTGLVYILSQIAGAFVGAFLVYLLYAGNFAGPDANLGIFYTGPAQGYENMPFTQYFSEFIGTFMLLLGVYAIVDNVRNVGPGANLWPFMVGMLVLSIGLSLGGPTGYAINPARDFGPRLFAAIVGDTAGFSGAYWLVPIIGPILGGIAGAFFYDFGIKPFLPSPAAPEPAPRGADVPHAPASEAR